MPLIGLMFDMNQLFERVVLRLLKRAAAVSAPDLSISGQDKRLFWRDQKIRPDIVIRRDDRVELIIDTKWKVPKDNKPADADLKQMYAYNLQFGSVRSVLLYPGDPSEDTDHIDYELGDGALEPHGCAVRFADLFEETGKLHMSWGGAVLRDLQIETETG
jgi:5-methylcytosine-specific restriction enzyme subunit McrC